MIFGQGSGIGRLVLAADEGFWPWAIARSDIPLVLTEGAKKGACLIQHGYLAIATSGCWNGLKQPRDANNRKDGPAYLLPEIELAAQAGRRIDLAFDNDGTAKAEKRGGVNDAVSKLGELLQRQGASVRVLQWLQYPEKGIDDLVAARGPAVLETVLAGAQPLAAWQSRRAHRLNYEPARKLNQRYVGEIAPPAERQLIGLKAPKGTGKTATISGVVAQAHRNNQRALLVSHRIQLGQHLSEHMGVPYASKVRTAEQGDALGLGLCADSLHPESQVRFQPEDWHGALLVIDECEHVLWHALNSRTCSDRRVPILASLRQTIANVISGGGRIVLADADLSDASIDFIRDTASNTLGTDLRPWIVENDWQAEGECWDIMHYPDKTPERVVEAAITELEAGGRPFIVTCSQQAHSKWGTQVLERELARRFPERSFLRIDRETVADPEHPAYGCIPAINEVLQRYDGAIVSPSIDTGVSIDVRGHFTALFAIAQGHLPARHFAQMLARLREPVPRHIWVSSKGIGSIANGSPSVKSLLASQHQASRANAQPFGALLQADFDTETGKPHSDSLTAWARFAAQVNRDMADYHTAVLAALRGEGNRLYDADDAEPDGGLSAELDSNRDDLYDTECRDIAQATMPDDLQQQRLKNQRSKPREQRHQERQGQLARRYGEAASRRPEVVAADDKGWYPQLRLHYFLGEGREYLYRRDHRSLQRQRERGGLWLPDFNCSQFAAAINALDKLGIPWLLQQQRVTADDLQFLAERAQADPWGVKVLLGVTISPSMTPVRIAQLLLGKLGFKLPYRGRYGPRGDRRRVYGAPEPIDDPVDRQAIFARWIERDRERAEREDDVSEPAIGKFYTSERGPEAEAEEAS
jgi:hypothetical protein